MATRKNIPLNISRPGKFDAFKLGWQASAHEQVNYIPYRYPFNDIENYDALAAVDYFRSGSKVVSTALGGNATAHNPSNLGFQLPYTEKLVLLVRVKANLTEDKHIKMTIKGSTQYNISDVVYVFTQDNDEEPGLEVVAGDVIEIDLYEFGLLIKDGELEIHTVDDATANADAAKLEFALIARMG